MFGEAWPYTNFHDLNLDWIIKTVKSMLEQVERGEKSIQEAKKEIDDLINNIDLDISERVEQAIIDTIESGEYEELIAAVANENVFFCVYPTMSQEIIQNAINTHSAIKFTPGIYTVYIPATGDFGYSIPSNRTIWFDNATIRKAGSFEHEYDNILLIDGSSNVALFGTGTVDYNRAATQLDSGEHGMCMTIGGGASHILISGIHFVNAWGDGLYVNNANYVRIKDVLCQNNRRNAISLIAGQHMRISDSYFLDSTGTAPGAGISIENNSSNDVLADVELRHCFCSGNVGYYGADVYATIKSNNSDVRLIDITAETPVHVTHYGNRSTVIVEDSHFGMKDTSDVFKVECPNDNIIRFRNCTIDGKGISSSGAFIDYTGNSLHNLYILNCTVRDLTLTGRAVRALGSREDVNNIIINCYTFGLNIPNPELMFQSTVLNPVIFWSLENGDLKLIDEPKPIVFNNNYVTGPVAIGTNQQTTANVRIANRADADVQIGSQPTYTDTGTGTSFIIKAGSFVKAETYLNGWYVTHLVASITPGSNTGD